MNRIGWPAVRNMHLGGKARGAALMLAIMAAVPGCAEHRVPRPATLIGSGPGNSAERAAQAVLTTDVASLRQEWSLFRAEQVLDSRCMRGLGFRYLVTSPGPEPSAGTVTDDAVGSGHPATYGVTATPERARGAPPGPGRPAEDQYVSSLPARMQARYVNALEGSSSADATLRLPSGAVGTYSTGGCVGQVRRQLYGSVRSAFEDPLVPHDMRYLLGIFLNSDRPYLSALHAWRQCMSAARWDFATPEAAIKSIQMLAATTGASPAEIDSRQVAIAGVDVSCDARSHLRMRISEARAQFARRQPSQIIAQLQRIYITREQAFRLALRVLSS